MPFTSFARLFCFIALSSDSHSVRALAFAHSPNVKSGNAQAGYLHSR